MNNIEDMIHKRSTEKVWIDGLGYCVEVKHYNELGVYQYNSYTPIVRG